MDIFRRGPPPSFFADRGKSLLTVVLGSFLAVSTIAAVAAEWTIKDLGNLGGDDQYAAEVEHLAFGINNHGQVVGWSITPTQIFREEPHNFLQAFVSAPNGGPLTNIHNIPAFYNNKPERSIETYSRATAINDAGIVVFNADRFHALPSALYTPPPYVYAYPVGPHNGGFLEARDINNQGQIAGSFTYIPVAFIGSTDGSTYIEIRNDINNPAAEVATGINDSGQASMNIERFGGPLIWSEAEGIRSIASNGRTVGINNAGQVLGVTGQGVGFLTEPDGGDLNYLDTFGGSFNQVMGLNNLGQVVGQAQDELGIYHAYFTGPNGQGLVDLDHEEDILNAGWTDIRVAAINDLGQIAGTGTHNGLRRPFLLTPIPEPETYAMILAGLSVLGFMRRRKSLRS